MSNPDRLTGLDSSFLHLEGEASHMHVAAAAVLEGPAPAYETLVDAIDRRLHLVPRYRQRLAFVPFQQGRPVWVDDPHFQVTFHVRHTALPRPGDDGALRRLAGRIFSQSLDRDRPLWEIWLVEGLREGRFALLFKTHHALVDGVSGIDIATVLFDTEPDAPGPPSEQEPWMPRPLPTAPQLLADALIERVSVPTEMARGVRAVVRGPLHAAERAGQAAVGLGAMALAGLRPAPRSPFNVRIGPHRRFTGARFALPDLKAIKNEFGVTINDVVLAAVAGALGRHLRRHGEPTDDVVLRAMVPVSIRSEDQRGTLGNRVAAMWAPMPVGLEDPVARLEVIHEAMADAKASGQALGAQLLTELPGFAPPTIVAQAARLQARQRMFNLVVTNVPGPQTPLYIVGRKLLAMYPMVPLAENTALGIALMSYNGSVFFGLAADYDAVPDLELLADDLRAAVAELRAAAGTELPAGVA